jgi:chromosome segregation ATPase|tara:strand:+ start:261 stop:548 length:288 start_codon:yes stop_codon:yes gene_type:complete
MMGTVTKEDVWKVVQMGLATLVLPLAGWVWNMNVEVAELKNDLGDAEVVIEKLNKEKDQYRIKEQKLTSQIVGIEKDIEYMKGSLSRIEQLVTSK